MKSSKLKKTLLAGLASGVSTLFLGGVGAAQEGPEAEQPTDVIVVTGRNFRDPSDSTATKLNIPLAETAGQVLVLNEELYDALGNISISDSISFIPGVTDFEANGNSGFFFTARGFGVNSRNAVRINGAPLGEDTLFDQVALNRLEYVKGSQSASYGQISAGGFINIGLKEGDSSEAIGNIRVQGDNWGGVRAEGSYGGPLNEDGTLRGLVAVSREASPGYYDGNERDISSGAFYGTLGADIGDELSVDYYLYYSDQDAPIIGGIGMGVDATDPANPVIGPLDVDRGFIGSGPFSRRDVELLFNQVVVNFDITDNQALRGSFSKVDTDANLTETDLSTGTGLGFAFVDLTPGSFGENLIAAESSDFNRTVDTTFAEIRYTGEFEITENARLNVIVSGELFRYEAEFMQFEVDDSVLPFPLGMDGPPPLIDIVSEDPINFGGNPFAGGRTILDGGFNTVQSEDINSVSLLASLDLYERLRLNGAIRHDDREAESGGTTFSNSTESYSASIAYDVTEDITAYYAYSKGFEFTTALTCEGASAPPEENRSHEGGVKWEPNPALLMSVAYFDAQATNALRNSIECPDGSVLPFGSELFDGEQFGKGVEFEVVGQITPNWNIAGGVSYIDDGFGDNPITTPETSINFFTTYDFTSGPLTGFSVGGGIRAALGVPGSEAIDAGRFDLTGVETLNGVAIADAIDDEGLLRLDEIIDSDLFEFFIVDALVAYQLTDALQLQVNARNLFNENYLPTPFATGGNRLGAPRQVIGSISFDF